MEARVTNIDVNPSSIPQQGIGAERTGAYAALFKALGDERRLQLLEAVAQDPGICACGLLDLFQMSQSTLSHHMRLLCDAGLVNCEKSGKWAHYRISDRGRLSIETFLTTVWKSQPGTDPARAPSSTQLGLPH